MLESKRSSLTSLIIMPSSLNQVNGTTSGETNQLLSFRLASATRSQRNADCRHCPDEVHRQRDHSDHTMSTPLLQQFPSLSSYPTSFLKDLLSSPELVEAFLFTLPEVQDLAAEVEKLGKENEELASECP